ncbi:hypothetical protein [Dulcicalothrix desertica]|nr:hypothetical protein [Dulcicalothrix desertica]
MLNFRCPSDLLGAIDQLGQQRYPADNNNGCDRSKTLIDIIAAGIKVLSDGSIEVSVSKTSSKTILTEELKSVIKDELLSEFQEVIKRELTGVKQEVDEKLAAFCERINTTEQFESTPKSKKKAPNLLVPVKGAEIPAPEEKAPNKNPAQKANTLTEVDKEVVKQSALIQIWLRVENNNKFIRRKKKVREYIERSCLSYYNAQKVTPSGYDYLVTIFYENDEDLDKQVYDLFREMDSIADMDYCFIEVDASEVGTDRRW